MSTNLSLIIPALAVTYLLLVYAGLSWWIRRAGDSGRTQG